MLYDPIFYKKNAYIHTYVYKYTKINYQVILRFLKQVMCMWSVSLYVCQSGRESRVGTLWGSPFSWHDKIHTVFITLQKIDSLFTLAMHWHTHTQGYILILSASPPARQHLGSMAFKAEISLTAVLPVWISPPFIRRTAGWTSTVTSKNLACLALQMSPVSLCVLFFHEQAEKPGEMTWPYQTAEHWVYLAHKGYVFFRVNIQGSRDQLTHHVPQLPLLFLTDLAFPVLWYCNTESLFPKCT